MATPTMRATTLAATRSAALGCRTSSAHVLGGVLSEYFGQPFAVEPLVGAWQRLPPEHRARLGIANAGLSGGMLPGTEVFGCDARARIRIGPLNKAGFNDFLPGAAGSVSLAEMLGLHCGAGIVYQIVLVLRAADVHRIRLVKPGEPGSARLGYDSWLNGRPGQAD